MAVAVQVNFPMQGPWGAEMAEAFRGLAENVNRFCKKGNKVTE